MDQHDIRADVRPDPDQPMVDIADDVTGYYTIDSDEAFDTAHELDPVQAAYNTGVQARWLDCNDTWLAAEWGHS